MSKLILNNVGNLADITTAAGVINNNNAVIVAALENTLSRDGTTPNQLEANLDVNSKRLLNLPAPATAAEPLRLQDLNNFLSNGIVSTLPAGGVTGTILRKVSSSDYDVVWDLLSSSVSKTDLGLGNVDNTSDSAKWVLTKTLTNTTIDTAYNNTIRLAGNQITNVTGTTGTVVLQTSPSITTPNITSPTGIVKGDVGLGSVDNTSDATKWAAAKTLTNTTIDTTFSNILRLAGSQITNVTGTTGVVVLQNSPILNSPSLVTPNLGTPSAAVLTNATGTAAGLTAGNVTTNANLTGDVTSVGNLTTVTNASVISKVLTGYVSGAGVVSASDSILSAIQKLNGNDATNANLTGPITSAGNATAIASQTGTGTKFVVDASPTLTGTPLTTTAAVDTNTTQIASTAFVIGQAASATPLIDGIAAAGTSTRFARGDHIHPTDTTRAPLASPTFTGTVTHPTPFTLGAISVTTTGTQLNYLSAATGTTGTTSTNLVFSASPTFTGTSVFTNTTNSGTLGVTGASTLTGNISTGVGGSGVNSSTITMNAGSGTASGAGIIYQRNTVNLWGTGHRSVINGDTSNDYEIWDYVGGVAAIRITSNSGAVTLGSTLTAVSLNTTTAPTAVSGAGPVAIGSASTLNSRMKINLNGTDYWLPCSTTAF